MEVVELRQSEPPTKLLPTLNPQDLAFRKFCAKDASDFIFGIVLPSTNI